MKKQAIVILTTLFAVSSAFALPAFKAEANKEVSTKVGAVLQKKAQDQKQESFVKVHEQVVANGSFSARDIVTPEFATEAFKANVDIRIADDGKYGDIMLAVYAPKGTKPTVTVEQHYVNAISNDPHAAVDLIVHVTINGKETKFVAAQAEAIELAYIIDYDAPSQNLPLKEATGKCPRCGAEDSYHCNASHTGPCVDEPVKVQKPAQEVVWERKHDKDCHDEYHCHCPSVVAEIVGNSLQGHKIEATKTVDAAAFTAVIFNTEDGISYKVTPKNGAELKVKVVTDSKTRSDPHQSLDTNLVIDELDANGKLKKTTSIFIISLDATTL